MTSTHLDGLPELHPFDPKASYRTWVPAAYDLTKWPTFPAAPVGNHRNLATISMLYRFYDADRLPLYIGVTTNPINRWGSHRTSDWWKLARFVSIAPVDPARRLLVEKEAILSERPRFNRTRETPLRAVIWLNQGMPEVIAQLRRRMSPEDFTELVRSFQAINSTTN